MADILARAMASNASDSAELANDRLDALPNGLNYKGVKNTVADLPANAEIGDCYTVKYNAQSIETNDEYGFGDDGGVHKWIKIGADLATSAYTGSYNDLVDKPTIPSISGLATETYVDTAVAAKQDTISDLSTIRTGAGLGATALQSVPNTYRTAAAQDVIDAGKQATISDLDDIRSGAALGATSIQSHQSLAAYRTSAAQDAIDADKQDKLIAGANITIAADGKTISATGGGSSLSADGTTIINNSGVLSAGIGGGKTVATEALEYFITNSYITPSGEQISYSKNNMTFTTEIPSYVFEYPSYYPTYYRDLVFNVDIEFESAATQHFEVTPSITASGIIKWTLSNNFEFILRDNINCLINNSTVFNNPFKVRITKKATYTYNQIDADYIKLGAGLKVSGHNLLTTNNNLVNTYSGVRTLDSRSDVQTGYAIGYEAYSSNDRSIAIGQNTYSTGNSYVFGSDSSIEVSGQTAVGAGLKIVNPSTSLRQMVVGKFNAVNNAAPFIIGCGADNSNRANALTVDSSANVHIKGNLYTGANADGTGGTLIDLSGLPFMVNYATFDAAAFTAAKAALNAGRLVYVNNVSDTEMGVGPLYNIPCFMTFTDDDNVEYLQFNMMDGSYFTTQGGDEGVSHALFKVFLTSTGNKNINIVEMSQTFSPQPTEDGPKMTALTVTTGDTTVFSLSDLNVEAGNFESGAHHYTINLAQATQAVAEGDYSFRASFDNGEERSGSCTLSLITEGGYYFFGQATSAGPFKDATLAPQGQAENLQYDLDIHIDGRN